MTRTRVGLLASSCGAVVLLYTLPGASTVSRVAPPPRLDVEPARLLADGYHGAQLTIFASADAAPRISLSGDATGARVEAATYRDGAWRSRIRAGIAPGQLEVSVQTAGAAPASARITAVLDRRDSFADGTPDSLRLDDEHDRLAFRRWFTWLAEAQYFQDPAARPAEINDCAALIRYAYREALRTHDTAWAAAVRLPALPAFESVSRYRYPQTPLGAALFRVRSGPFLAADLNDGAFLQFADAQTLWRWNTHPAGRDLARAMPGDLLFYRRREPRTTFHSMIYLGESPLGPDGRRYILYHTGPDENGPGEMRRLTVEEMLRFPQAEWRPLAGNPDFLGVARFNILKRETGTR